MAISVNTLTTGSQATVCLRSAGFVTGGARKVLRAFSAAGMRRTIDVAESPSSRSEIVCVRAGDPATRARRSALAPRLMDASGAIEEFCEDEEFCEEF